MNPPLRKTSPTEVIHTRIGGVIPKWSHPSSQLFRIGISLQKASSS